MAQNISTIELVRKFYSRSLPLRSSTLDSTMGNGSSTGQGGYTTHGLRDVGKSVQLQEHFWPSEELAENKFAIRPKSLHWRPNAGPEVFITKCNGRMFKFCREQRGQVIIDTFIGT